MHSTGIISLSPLSLADRCDWSDTRGKWPLARNPDRSVKLFWPQAMTPWRSGLLYRLTAKLVIEMGSTYEYTLYGVSGLEGPQCKNTSSCIRSFLYSYHLSLFAHSNLFFLIPFRMSSNQVSNTSHVPNSVLLFCPLNMSYSDELWTCDCANNL